MFGFIEHYKSGGVARCYESAVEFANFRSVSSRETNSHFGRDISQRRQHRDHSQNAERLNSRTCRRVSAENHAIELLQFLRGPQSEERGPLIAIVDNLQRPFGLLAQTDDLIVRQRQPARYLCRSDLTPESKDRQYEWCSEFRTSAPRPPFAVR
jgi:hypothetical protein